ncbi:Flp pilus assembly protein CpaB [Aeromicrobium sp.]|uniref:Flp pilus assembly protein CpaB n=1 Tax=Aeromicrobium sp. TaxID=1871063 RepID=UPI002FCC5E36
MNRRLGLTALAVVLALIGTVAVFAYAKSADRRAVDGIEAASVLIVDETIPLGTSWNDVVEGGFVSEEKLPVRATPSTALRDLDADVPDGEVATAEIKPGQVVVRAMFGERAPATGKLAIPARMQAITIKVPANAEVAGFVRNGSEVAVYATFKVEEAQDADGKAIAGDDAFASKLLLPRVSVLAVSQAPPSNVSGTGDDESGGLAGSRAVDAEVLVTLSVDQAAAERILLAQEIGKLYLTLLTNSSVTKDSGGRINLGNFAPTPLFRK